MWAGPPDPEGTFDVEDAAEAFIRFRNGITFQLSVAWASHLPEAAMREQVVLFGEKGALAAETWGGRLLLGHDDEATRQMIDVTPVRAPGDAWTTAWRAQHRRLREIFSTKDAPTTATAEHGRAVQAIVDGIYASSEAGREVELES
ncbi:MAG: Gfo/Idh/MocA family oxidoreductase, partial [Pseudomonadales bacterium]|jgi:predicted dehydrogenase|nr:Gfo/Idh/MocA family oxidoreductase [Pseudomonadales bacterium]